jgi:hypothetical protein
MGMGMGMGGMMGMGMDQSLYRCVRDSLRRPSFGRHDFVEPVLLMALAKRVHSRRGAQCSVKSRVDFLDSLADWKVLQVLARHACSPVYPIQHSLAAGAFGTSNLSDLHSRPFC